MKDQLCKAIFYPFSLTNLIGQSFFGRLFKKLQLLAKWRTFGQSWCLRRKKTFLHMENTTTRSKRNAVVAFRSCKNRFDSQKVDASSTIQSEDFVLVALNVQSKNSCRKHHENLPLKSPVSEREVVL